jgi:prepilin-type N-terminal cleavage/methylation domain-containing protein
MRKGNRGFTLIELLIAISVLSIMGGVLLHSFVISRHYNTKARSDEVILDAAERTMEAIKGDSLTKLDQTIQTAKKQAGESSNLQGTCSLGNVVYAYTADGEGYTLRKQEDLSMVGRTGNYLVEAQIRWSPYGTPGVTATESDARTTPNTYQMPRIADVNTPQNMVVNYEDLLQKEEQWSIYFQSNYAKEDDDEASETDESVTYDYSQTKRYLWLKLTKEGTKMCVEPVLYYLLDGADLSLSALKNKLSGTYEGTAYSLGKKKREIASDTDQQPRIYLFLPDRDMTTVSVRRKKTTDGGEQEETVTMTSHFKLDGILVDDRCNQYCELYVIPEADAVGVTGDIVSQNDKSNGLTATAEVKNTGVNLYTYENNRLFIPAEEAYKRLYEITVSLYETPAMSDENGVIHWEKTESAVPLIQLQSTKQE